MLRCETQECMWTGENWGRFVAICLLGSACYYTRDIVSGCCENQSSNLGSERYSAYDYVIPVQLGQTPRFG